MSRSSERKKARSGKGFFAVMVGQRWMLEQIDFLTFGQVKNLIVMDFQPLFQNEAYGAEWTGEYIHSFLFDLERKLASAIA